MSISPVSGGAAHVITAQAALKAQRAATTRAAQAQAQAVAPTDSDGDHDHGRIDVRA